MFTLVPQDFHVGESTLRIFFRVTETVASLVEVEGCDTGEKTAWATHLLHGL